MTATTHLLASAGVILGSFLIGAAVGLLFEARRRSPARLLRRAAIAGGFGAIVIVVSFGLGTSALKLPAPGWWTDLFFAALIAAGGVGLIRWGRRWDPADGRLRCPRCWYSMAGASASSVCPECGHTPDSPDALLQTRPSRPAIVVGVLVVVMACLATIGLITTGGEWRPLIPNTVLIAMTDGAMSNWAADELNRRAAMGGQAGAGFVDVGVVASGMRERGMLRPPSRASRQILTVLPWEDVNGSALFDWQWAWVADRIDERGPAGVFILAAVPHERANHHLRQAVADGVPDAELALAARMGRDPASFVGDASIDTVLDDSEAWDWFVASIADVDAAMAIIGSRMDRIDTPAAAAAFASDLLQSGVRARPELDAFIWRWIARSPIDDQRALFDVFLDRPGMNWQVATTLSRLQREHAAELEAVLDARERMSFGPRREMERLAALVEVLDDHRDPHARQMGRYAAAVVAAWREAEALNAARAAAEAGEAPGTDPGGS